MRILIITGIFPPDVGGPASYVPAIAASLANRGHGITVITLSDSCCHADCEYPFTVIRILRPGARPWRVLKTMAAIVRNGRQADLLFVHGLALEAVLANLLLGKPLVHKIVGDLVWERACSQGTVTDDLETFQRKRYSRKIELLKRLRSFWVNKSDRIITPSRFLKKIVSSWGVPEENITVIYNAVDTAHMEAAVTQSVHAPPHAADEKKTIVSAGRLVPWKGFASLISVMEQFPEAQLSIIGDGPERRRLEALIRHKNLHERVRILGTVSRRELFAALKHADLFVLNSTYEGLPHIVLEALKAQVPVIATDSGGTSEIIQHGYNGLLVPAADESALSAAIKLLLADAKLCSRLAKNGAASLDSFIWSDLVDQTENLLTEVYNEKKQQIPVLFLSSTRHPDPPDQTLRKKWRGLAPFFRATVIAFGDRPLPTRQWFEGLRCILIPAGLPRVARYLVHFMYSWCYTLGGALTHKYRAIIAQSPYEALAPALALLPWKLSGSSGKPKLIVELHSDWQEGAMLYHQAAPFARLEKHLRKCVGRFSLSQADAFRGVSQYCLRLVSERHKPAYVFCAFSDFESFTAMASDTTSEAVGAVNAPYFIYAGMLIYLKGIHFLIRAMQHVAARHSQVKLVIAGTGAEEQNLKSLVQNLGMTDQVLFVGHLSQRALAVYVKNCLALVLPSLTEGLPRVIIEAQLLGRPVIASRVGGIPDLIADGETGILVEPNDYIGLSRAMLRIIEDPLFAQCLARAAQERATQTYNNKNYFTAYHDMVRQVCSPEP